MGNFETKHSPYYAITDDSVNEDVTGSRSTDTNSSQSLWKVRRANYDGKNGSLFELNGNRITQNDTKGQANKQLGYALNQIRTLKKIRHPNIVKYFYSEEPVKSQVPIPHTHPSFKCVLITEFVRPLTNLVESLTSEQIYHGIYGITNAIQFLHEKTQTSHNNLSESCIYVNCKQVWKLNDFELALSFTSLTKENLRGIYELKQKNAITPEEEVNYKEPNQSKMDLNRIYQEAPHSIDAYGWAITILNLVSNGNKKKSFKAFFGDESTNQNGENTSAEQLELYLSTDPTERPTLKNALDINLFSSYKTNAEENSTESQLFKIDNLEDLEKNFTMLLNYCSNLPADSVNEKLIDFLLRPFMFFSERMRKEIFPMLFIPKEVYVGEENFQTKLDFTNFYFSVYQNYMTGKCMHNEMTMGISIEPFMDLNKYKTFVIPRILNLLTMHSTQIRLVLLEYFPFYIGHINDDQSLHYEILPELLVGLKDKNDDLVSLTFSCLSIIVKILGSEIVIGKSSSKKRQNIFSNNLPKSISVDFKEALDDSSNSLKVPNETGKITNFHKNKSADFGSDKFKENVAFHLNERTKFSSATSLDQDMITMNGSMKSSSVKLISDSMIGLHGETEEGSVERTTSNTETKSQNEIESKSSAYDASDDNCTGFNSKINGHDDGWSNDWNDNWDNEDEEKPDQNHSSYSHHEKGSASLVSLAGSVDLLVPQEQKIIKNFTPSKKLTEPLKKLKGPTPSKKKTNQDNFSEYDIKSIVIKKKDEPNLIDEFFSDMQPTIAKKQQTPTNTNGYGRLIEKDSAALKLPHSPAITETSKKLLVDNMMPNVNSEVSWECEDIELDEV